MSTISLNSVSCGQFFASYYINKTILPICLMSFSRLLSWRYVDVNILSMDCLDVVETLNHFVLLLRHTEFTLLSEINQSIGTLSYIVIFVSTQDSFVNVSFQARI